MSIRAQVLTHPGKVRTQNEDHHLIDSELSLFIVSDGVTHPSGAYCSEKVCSKIQKYILEHRKIIEAQAKDNSSINRQALIDLIRRSIELVSLTIFQETQTQSQMRGVFATATVVLVSRGYAFIGHLGDSRVYSILNGSFHVLTRDHTYLSSMLAEGKSLEDARKVNYCDNLSAAVGYHPVARASVQIRELAPGERLLLCTDGLSDHFGHGSFRAQEWASTNSDRLAQILCDHALKRNARDNLTALIIDWDARVERGVERGREHGNERTSPSPDVLQKLGTVRGIGIFQHLGDRSLMKVLSLSDTREIKPGETLIRRGQVLDEIFITLSGELSVDLGNGPITPSVKRGEVLGEMSLFDGGLTSATLVALQPTLVLSLHREQLFQAMREDPVFAARFELGVLQAVIRRLRLRTEPDEDLKSLQNHAVVTILPPEES